MTQWKVPSLDGVEMSDTATPKASQFRSFRRTEGRNINRKTVTFWCVCLCVYRPGGTVYADEFSLEASAIDLLQNNLSEEDLYYPAPSTVRNRIHCHSSSSASSFYLQCIDLKQKTIQKSRRKRKGAYWKKLAVKNLGDKKVVWSECVFNKVL